MNAKVDLLTTLKSSFPVRRMDFEFKNVLKYWVNADPCSTHMFSAMSVMFPDGERYFVDSVRAVRDLITDDPQLQKDISAFIGQEAMHAKEHHSFHLNAEVHGLDPESLERFTFNLLDKATKLIIRNGKQQRLAVTCALEHFTGTIAAQLMRREDIQDLMQDETMKHLWLWHSVEENEHKAVAYDVYEKIYGTGPAAYLNRVVIMAIAITLIIAVKFGFLTTLMYRDGQLTNFSSWKKGLSLFWGREGFFTQIIPETWDYFRPNFHPWQHNTHDLLNKYRAKLGMSS
ncbi:metal-dependent hydrolase [Aquirhabdus sp.]|uniref:metal-dependent hydrolase n=1 Tax=Aquirhabdus sp. TaxID=2824160 RepID=UPI00396CDBB0